MAGREERKEIRRTAGGQAESAGPDKLRRCLATPRTERRRQKGRQGQRGPALVCLSPLVDDSASRSPARAAGTGYRAQLQHDLAPHRQSTPVTDSADSSFEAALSSPAAQRQDLGPVPQPADPPHPRRAAAFFEPGHFEDAPEPLHRSPTSSEAGPPHRRQRETSATASSYGGSSPDPLYMGPQPAAGPSQLRNNVRHIRGPAPKRARVGEEEGEKDLEGNDGVQDDKGEEGEDDEDEDDEGDEDPALKAMLDALAKTPHGLAAMERRVRKAQKENGAGRSGGKGKGRALE